MKIGFLGTKSTLIPMEAVRADEGHKRIEVSVEKDRVKEGPPFEESVRYHYGLEISASAAARGAYGSYHEDVGEERWRVKKEPIDSAQRGGEEVRGAGFAAEEPPIQGQKAPRVDIRRRSIHPRWRVRASAAALPFGTMTS